MDTNVLLSGLMFRGNESRLLQLALDGSIRLLLAEVVLGEAMSVLTARFPKHVEVLDRFLNVVDFERVPYPQEDALRAAAGLLRDPNDAPILASALLASPDAALTGDKDLLTDAVRQIAPFQRCADYLHERRTSRR